MWKLGLNDAAVESGAPGLGLLQLISLQDAAHFLV